MFKIVYRNCAGIDVHKKTIVVTIAKTNDRDITDYQTKSFSTFTEDLMQYRNKLVYNRTGEVFDYERFDILLNRNFKSNKHIKNSPEEMISY